MDRKPLDEETRCQEENVRFCRFSRSKVGSWKNIFKKFACQRWLSLNLNENLFQHFAPSRYPHSRTQLFDRNGEEPSTRNKMTKQFPQGASPAHNSTYWYLYWCGSWCFVLFFDLLYFEWIVLWMKYRWEHKGYHDVVADNMKKTKFFFRIRKAARTLESSCLYYRCHAYSKRAAPTLSD